MKLFKNAKACAVGSIAKQQIDENIKDLQEWINDKPDRELNRQIGNDVKSIIEKLNLAAETLKNQGKYPKGYDDPYSHLALEDQPHNLGLKSSHSILNTQPGKIESIVPSYNDFIPSKLNKGEYNINLFRLARDTVKYCKPKLDNIKSITGSSNELFLKLSNDVASISLACLIDYVNNSGNPAFNIPPNVDENEIKVMNSIGELDMNLEMRKRYNDQKEALNNLKNPRRNPTTSKKLNGKNWVDENPGCLIAIIIGAIILLISIFSN
jgi:hypothetical protein